MNDQALVLSEKHTQFIVWTLLCLMPIIGMVVDLIAPSLPAIAVSLHVSNKVAKNVISVYLLGYALGNFFTGFLTDALGRQKLIRLGLLGFVIASLLPVFFPHITILLLARFLQGITIGSVAVLSRAIFSDVLPPEKLIRLGTLVGTMWGLGPIIGPVIGGYLQFYFDWRAGFCFLGLIAFLGLVVTWRVIPETHFKRHALNVKTITQNLFEIIMNRFFMAIVILMGLVYSLIISFNTLGPFLIQTQFHYSPVYFGHFALSVGLVFLLATFVCRFLLKTNKFEQLLFVGINFFFFVTVLLLIASYFFNRSIVLVALASAFMFFACGFLFPMSIGKGASLFRHIAGTANAIMFLINILITSLVSFLISFVNVQSVVSLLWIYFLLIFMSTLVYWVWLRHH